MGFLHTFKNYTGGYTSSQRKVRDVTSDSIEDPWDYEMRAVANLTFKENQVEPIMEILFRRMNDKRRYYRHVEKSLILLNYLVRYGSVGVVESVNNNIFLLQMLSEYQYTEYGKEVGGRIRAISKAVIALVKDKPRLELVRHEAAIELKIQNRKGLELVLKNLANAKTAEMALHAMDNQ